MNQQDRDRQQKQLSYRLHICEMYKKPTVLSTAVTENVFLSSLKSYNLVYDTIFILWNQSTDS